MVNLEEIAELGEQLNSKHIIKVPIREYAGDGDDDYRTVGEIDSKEYVYSGEERRVAYDRLKRIKKSTQDKEIRRECKKHLRWVSKPYVPLSVEEANKHTDNFLLGILIPSAIASGYMTYKYLNMKGR